MELVLDSKSVNAHIVEDDRYDEFLSAIRNKFNKVIESGEQIFTTDASNLYETYLDTSPIESKQSRTCRNCQNFIERFGGLVTISADGKTSSILWDVDAPPAYANTAKALTKLVNKAKVTGVFISSDKVWGIPVTGKWTHFSVNFPQTRVWSSPILNASQKMAEKSEEYRMLVRGLEEFATNTFKVAYSYLTNNSLYRSEKCEAVAKFLLDICSMRELIKSSQVKHNLTWKFVASAPAGFCHVKQGMIGSLLEDIEANLPFEDIKRKFDTKMDPLKYQRPQSEPSDGNIAQAEKIVGQLKSARSLERRFAKLNDVKTIWKPVVKNISNEGVFGHLKNKTQSIVDNGATPIIMTWEKFSKTILPNAEKIELFVDSGYDSYGAMITAADMEAPPIVQWDFLENRNPVTWYVYSGGSLPRMWNINTGYCDVTALVLNPAMWDETKNFSHQGKSVIFVLNKAYDTCYKQGAGLFLELIKSEYHSVRKTIEAHIKSSIVSGAKEAEVCGLIFTNGRSRNIQLKVTSNGIVSRYTLDRWD